MAGGLPLNSRNMTGTVTSTPLKKPEVPAKAPTTYKPKPYIEEKKLPEDISEGEASYLESGMASLKGTLIGNVWTAAERPFFNKDPDFDTEAGVKNMIGKLGYVPSDDQLEYLLKARSEEELNYNWTQLQTKEKNEKIAAQNAKVAFAAGLADPLEFVIGMATGGLGKAATAAGNINRVRRAATGFASGTLFGTALYGGMSSAVPLSNSDIAFGAIGTGVGGIFDMNTFEGAGKAIAGKFKKGGNTDAPKNDTRAADVDPETGEILPPKNEPTEDVDRWEGVEDDTTRPIGEGASGIVYDKDGNVVGNYANDPNNTVSPDAPSTPNVTPQPTGNGMSSVPNMGNTVVPSNPTPDVEVKPASSPEDQIGTKAEDAAEVAVDETIQPEESTPVGGRVDADEPATAEVINFRLKSHRRSGDSGKIASVSMKDALEAVVNKGKGLQAFIAKRLLMGATPEFLAKNVNYTTSLNERSLGNYEFSNGEVYIAANRDDIMDAADPTQYSTRHDNTLLHEATHARVAEILQTAMEKGLVNGGLKPAAARKVGEFTTGVKGMSDAVVRNIQTLENIFEKVKMDNAAISHQVYGLTNLHEFVAEAMNPDSALTKILRKTKATGFRNAWEQIKSIFTKILSGADEGSAYEEVVDLVDELFNTKVEVPKSLDQMSVPELNQLQNKVKNMNFDWFNKFMSMHDSLSSLGAKGKALANLVLADAVGGTATSAATAARNFLLDGEVRLKKFEDVAKELGLYDRHIFNRKEALKVIKLRQRLFREAQIHMLKAEAAEKAANAAAGAKNLGLMPKDIVDPNNIELPADLKQFRNDQITWFNKNVDMDLTGTTPDMKDVIHGFDTDTGELFRIRETELQRPQNSTGTTAVGNAPKRKESELMTDDGRWLTRAQIRSEVKAHLGGNATRQDIDDFMANADAATKKSLGFFPTIKTADELYLWQYGQPRPPDPTLAAFASGTNGKIPDHPDPRVMKLVNAYADSGYAETTLRRAKQHDVEGAKDTEFSKFHTSIVWDYDGMNRLGIPMPAIADAFGGQLLRMLPDLPQDAATARSLGMSFLGRLQGGNTGDKLLKRTVAQEFNGLSKDNIIAVLKDHGMDDVSIAKSMNNLFGTPTTANVGNVTTALRTRTGWDLFENFELADGTSFQLVDFLDNNLDENLHRNNLQMSARIGLARVGIRSGGELQRMLDDVFDSSPLKDTDPEEARRILDHVRDTILGRPTGEPMHEIMRSATTIGSLLMLANSAIYNLVDFARLAQKHGIARTARAIPQFKKMLDFKELTSGQLTTLKDIIAGRVMIEGRLAPIVTHLDDNYKGAISGVHEKINYYGQYGRFANGSEHVRRGMVAMNAGIMEARLDGVISGNADDIEYFRKIGVSDELMDRVKAQHAKHGWHMEQWDSSYDADELSTILINDIDNSVLALRRGERPIMLDSAHGKVLFPFMSFVFAAHNKLLRGTLKQDGAAGLATLLLYQFPLAMMANGIINVTNGREADENLLTGTGKAMAGLGIWSMPLDFVARGEFGGAAPAFGAVNAVGRAAKTIATGDTQALEIAKAIPILGVNPAVRLLTSTFDKD